jgi:hypothetical protein
MITQQFTNYTGDIFNRSMSIIQFNNAEYYYQDFRIDFIGKINNWRVEANPIFIEQQEDYDEVHTETLPKVTSAVEASKLLLLNFRGNWTNANPYIKGDWVLYNNLKYICKVDRPILSDAPVDGIYWCELTSGKALKTNEGNAESDFKARKIVLEGSGEPTLSTNPDLVGTQYIDLDSGQVYVCIDNTIDVNVWVGQEGGYVGGYLPYFGGLGLFGGGSVATASFSNTIDYVTIATPSNAIDFGDLTEARAYLASCSNGSLGLFGGGYDGSNFNIIDYVTIATPSNAIDFGDLTVARREVSACSDGSRGLFGGGNIGSFPNTIDYVTIATPSNAIDFGDLTEARDYLASCSDGAKGLFGGGYYSNNTIDYVTIATPSNAIDFGDLTVARRALASCSDGTKGLFGGGLDFSSFNIIDYITIATPSNATDFGDLTVARRALASCSDGAKGLFGGGYDSSYTNTIDYVTIATPSNATDFGDLTVARAGLASCSGD